MSLLQKYHLSLENPSNHSYLTARVPINFLTGISRVAVLPQLQRRFIRDRVNPRGSFIRRLICSVKVMQSITFLLLHTLGFLTQNSSICSSSRLVKKSRGGCIMLLEANRRTTQTDVNVLCLVALNAVVFSASLAFHAFYSLREL